MSGTPEKKAAHLTGGESHRKGAIAVQKLTHPAQKAPLFLFLFFVSFYLLTNAGWYQSGDEFTMVKVARKIIGAGQIGFELEETAKECEDDLVRGPSGLYYYKYGLGQSLVEIPFLLLHRLLFQTVSTQMGYYHSAPDYSMSELLFLLLCPSLVSALGCVLLYHFACLLGFSRATSVSLALIYGLGTMAWPYSKSLMSETTLNVAILGGVYATVCYKCTTRHRWLALSGVLMGFSFITKATSVLIIPILVVYLVFAFSPRRVLLDLLFYFGMPFLAFVGVQGFHNMVRYGNFFEFGYGFGWDSLGFSTPLSVGLWGLIVSPGKSFFLYSPAAILGVIWFRRFLERRKGEALLFLGIVLSLILLHACWWAWSGDRAWGPRFLLPITPYFMLFLGEVSDSWRGRSKLYRQFCIILVVLSIAIQVLGVTIDPHQFPRYRSQMVGELVESPNMNPLRLFLDLSFVHFNPIMSHVLGNVWLSKHMLYSYDLWSDPPWKMLKRFGLEKSKPSDEDRIVPFWWPIAFPLISPRSILWVYPLAAVNFLLVAWWGLKLWRRLKAGNGDLQFFLR